MIVRAVRAAVRSAAGSSTRRRSTPAPPSADSMNRARPRPSSSGRLSLVSSLSSSWNAASMPRSSAIAAVTAVSAGDRAGQPGDEDVPAVLHVGDDPLLAPDLRGGFQAVFLGGLVLLVLLEPAARGHVDQVALHVGVDAAAAADIGLPDRRRVAVGEGQDLARPCRR